MKKLNLPLILGGIIIFFIIIIILFPQMFTDVNPYGIQQIKVWVEEGGKFRLEAAPFPPSKNAILGTDCLGRDTWSFIIYGTRLTITLSLLVVMGRFLIALPMGISAGFGSLVSKAVINQFNVIFSAIPALLISLIILKLDFFVGLDKQYSILAFVLVLSIVGWSKLGTIIMERVQEILAKPFIKGEIAIGKSRLRIAVENVIPHLAAEIVVLFFMEIARALTIIMQLGIFGVYVGNLRIIEDTDFGRIKTMDISFEPEWASMLGTARNEIRTAPWNVFSPAFAFFISVLGFNLFGEGLRNYLQQRDSKFITVLRRVLSFNIKKQLSTLTKYKLKKLSFKSAIIFTTCILILASLVFADNNKYEFALPDSTYVFGKGVENQVVIGSDEAEDLALRIAQEMKKLGLKPVYEGGFIKEYEVPNIYIPLSTDFVIRVDNSQSKLALGKDYSLLSFGDFDLSGGIYNAARDDMFNIKDYEKFSGKFVVIDKTFYTDYAVKHFTENILEKSDAKGVLCIIRDGEKLQNSIGEKGYNGIVAEITRDLGNLLINNGDVRIDISVRSQKLNNKGRNILGLYPGEDKTVGEEAIIIGMGYNYTDKDTGEKKVKFALELMRKLVEDNSNRNRSIIFAFWDGTLKDEYHGVRDYCEDVLYPIKKTTLYIDLTKLNSYKYDYLYYSSEQAPITRYFGWSLGHQLEKNFAREDIMLKDYEVKDYHETLWEGSLVDNKLFIERGIATIIIGTEDGNDEGRFGLESLGEILAKTINENNY